MIGNDAEYIEGVKFRVRVIEDYIKYSWLNVEKGKRVFKKFDVEETRTKLLKNDPVNLLQDKWYRADSDDFIVNNMNAVIENARKEYMILAPTIEYYKFFCKSTRLDSILNIQIDCLKQCVKELKQREPLEFWIV